MEEARMLSDEQTEKVSGGAFPPPYTVKNSNDNAIYGAVNAGDGIIIADNIVSDGGAIYNSVNTGILDDNSTVVKSSQSIR